MKIGITAESTIDLPQELLEKFGIETTPFTIMLGEKPGFDGVVTPKEIFDYVDETGTLPRTSAINEFQYHEFFKGLKKKYDAIIHVSLSSQISSACQNAKHAAEIMKDIYVVDSKSLSTGIALLCIYARQLVDQGLEAKEIFKKLEQRRSAVQASFVVNTLNYLHKGGRCSSLARFGANLLRIKPQIIVTPEGKMVSGAKYRGKNREVVEDYCKDTLAKYNNPDHSIIFITHSMASPDMVEAARRIVERHGFNNIYETVAGATISSHCGPKTLGILYFNDGDK